MNEESALPTQGPINMCRLAPPRNPSHTHTHTQNGGNQWDDLIASALCPQGVNSIHRYV